MAEYENGMNQRGNRKDVFKIFAVSMKKSSSLFAGAASAPSSFHLCFIHSSRNDYSLMKRGQIVV